MGFHRRAGVVPELWIPLQDLSGATLTKRLTVVGGLTALPLFFSGLVFAH